MNETKNTGSEKIFVADAIEAAKATLTNKAKKSCKRCYGRGWLGIDTIHKKLHACKCVHL